MGSLCFFWSLINCGGGLKKKAASRMGFPKKNGNQLVFMP